MALSSPYKPSRLLSPSRARQLHRALKNLKLTLICGLLTILVLRGALGAGKFGTPAKDFEELKHQFERVHSLHITRKHASRVLAEVIEERQRPLEAIQAQAHSTSYFVSEEQSKDRLQGNYAFQEGNLDVKFTIDLTKPSALSSKADAKGSATLLTNRNPHVGNKLKMMLVTGYHPSACENPTGAHYLLKFVKNKADYCKLHGIQILYSSAFLEAEVSGLSAKLLILRKLMLTHPEVEWFWWMASDTLFTDMAFELPLEKYENYSVVFHGSDNMQRTGAALTSGSFLIRNGQGSWNMLDTWAKSLAGQANGGDKSVLAHALISEKKIRGKEVLVEKSIFLHSYSEVSAIQSEEAITKMHNDGDDESQPFVTRFVGHKLCKKGADDGNNDVALYIKYMERALDMADSQVLQLSNIRQKSSSSSALRRLRGGHDGSIVSRSDVSPSTSGSIQE